MERLRMVGGGTVASCPFPVGFGGFFHTDPNTLYSGTKWEQKKDVFILAAGDTYSAGSTGGEAKHTHKYGFQLGSYYGSLSLSGDHAGALQGGTGKPVGKVTAESATATFNNSTVEKTMSHEAVYFKSIADTSSASNMPPYFAMPFWIRTA